MRISDWSSDVCSSDLAEQRRDDIEQRRRGGKRAEEGKVGVRRLDAADARRLRRVAVLEVELLVACGKAGGAGDDLLRHAPDLGEAIGRASGREGGGQDG